MYLMSFVRSLEDMIGVDRGEGKDCNGGGWTDNACMPNQ